MPEGPTYYARPNLTYATVGVVPLAERFSELRVAAKRTTARDSVSLTEVRRLKSGRWCRRRGILLRAHSIRHLIRLLERALEVLPDLPAPPERAMVPGRSEDGP